MQLEVLIVTPSGPFGELIRLTLEADPEFHCAMLDNSGDLRATLQEKPCQAVIYDCSFPLPVPAQVVTTLHEDFPETAILLIPADNRSESSIPADGWVTRPFDASSLADAVKNAINKRLHPEAVKFIPKEPERKPSSWWNAFQSGIRETAADSGLMIQNGLVIASTPNLSTALQQQVTASVLRFWNPEESSDLMRYVKDLVNGQEWMMYATRAADGAVLVLLYLPQTPVTRVRAQTLKLAKDVAGLMVKPQGTSPSNLHENAEPPRLHEILGEKTGTGHVIKNGFPVEWFREADLPDFQAESSTEEDTTPETTPIGSAATEPDMVLPVGAETGVEESPALEEMQEESLPLEAADELSSGDMPVDEIAPVETTNVEDKSDILPSSTGAQPEPGSQVETTPLPPSEEDTLGKFQAVDLLSEQKPETGLDEMQPISLQEIQPESSLKEQFEALAELETSLETAQPVEESIPSEPEPSIPVPDMTEPPSVTRDEVEEALSILSNRLNMENPAEDTSPEADTVSEILDAQKILTETDSTGIDVESFQAELSRLEFNDTWSMPEILTGSPQEPSNITSSESEEMATFLAGIEAQTPRLNSVETHPEESETEEALSALEGGSQPVDVPVPFSEDEPLVNPVSPDLAEPVSTLETSLPIGEQIPSEPAPMEEITGTISVAENLPSAVEAEAQPESAPNDLFARTSQLETQAEPDGLTTYTIALIPGAENHFLQRQNAAVLSETMNRLALAFNWTLENLTIRPTYMQWTLTMAATLPPEDMVRIVRKETTVELKKANPDDLASVGEDYWYPQTMSATGRDFVPSIHWQDFILRRKTREVA